MTLFSSPICALSHCARLVLNEKDISTSDVTFFNPAEPPEELLQYNPTGISPTLIERDLVIYDAHIIMEYLDERFPHPPLHQMDPVARAKTRMIIKRIDQDWYRLLDEVINSGEKKSARSKKLLKESLTSSLPIFQANTYFMSDEYSLIDCVMAPLLWRLPSLGIDLDNLGAPIASYAEQLFARSAFQASLSDDERDMASYKK